MTQTQAPQPLCAQAGRPQKAGILSRSRRSPGLPHVWGRDVTLHRLVGQVQADLGALVLLVALLPAPDLSGCVLCAGALGCPPTPALRGVLRFSRPLQCGEDLAWRCLSVALQQLPSVASCAGVGDAWTHESHCALNPCPGSLTCRGRLQVASAFAWTAAGCVSRLQLLPATG